jgi:dihydrofolate reductase
MTTHRPKLHLIYARAANGVIGKDGVMPWHLPEDLAHFKRTTLGAPVIMGRKTWDSLPPRFRPLPGRRNVVLTRQPDWKAEGVHGEAAVAGTLDEAVQLCQDAPDVWIIGGAQLYAQALPLACTAVVTEIEADFEGDAYAPELGPAWVETARERLVAANGLALSFVHYRNTAV